MLRDEPITEKVDVYSFAVLMWEIYTGKLPWSDKSCAQMVHTVAITHSRPPIPGECPKVQPPPLAYGPILPLQLPLSITRLTPPPFAETGGVDDQVLGTAARGAPRFPRSACDAQGDPGGAQVNGLGR